MSTIANVTRRLDLLWLWRIETFRPEQLTGRDRKLGRIFGIAIVAIILAVGARQGALTYRENLATAAFYQTYFGPALNFACNGAYNEIKQNQEVQRFLERKSNSLDSCSGVEGLPLRTVNGLERSMVYLELASAIAWRVLGFNWQNLFVVAAALASGFALACYSLLRVFFVSRLASAALAFTVILSSPVTSQIPHLRDFSKALFIIGALACLASVVLRPHRLFPMLLLSIAAGALVSVGLGFRPDTNIVLPIAFLAPLLLIGTDTWRRVGFRMALAWTSFTIGYISFYLPLWLVGGTDANHSGNFISHVFILGFADQFLSGALGMADACYDVLRLYFDGLVHAVVSLFDGSPQDPAIFFGHSDYSSFVSLGSPKYEKVSGALFKSILLLVPYDFLLRFFYTANTIGHLPINTAIWGLPILLAAPVFLLVRPRCFLFVLVAFGILAAVLSLQYDPRHAFHMVLLGATIVALTVSTALDVVRQTRASGFAVSRRMGNRIGSLAASIALTTTLLALVSHFLAVSQQTALQALVKAYAAIEWETIRAREISNSLEPIFIDRPGKPRAYALKGGTEGATQKPLGLGTFSRLTFKIGSKPANSVVLPVQLSWSAVQEGRALGDKQFAYSTAKDGYAVESNSISGINLSSLLNKSDGGQSLWLKISGETLRGSFSVGLLNGNKSKFAFLDRLPHGSWSFMKQFRITSDLDWMTVLFANNAGQRSSVRVDSVEFVTFPERGCGLPHATLSTNYDYLDQKLNLGGFALPERTGVATYYFPQAFTPSLNFTGLNLDSISPDCIIDWSVAKNFPAGTVPAELLLIDGQLTNFQRGDWMSIWRDFIN